jgi:ubiquinone/menaquinone biosynthesis C-methylase UbiE
MASFAGTFGIYRPLWPKVGTIIRGLGERRIVDLCSGSGGPVLELARSIDHEGDGGLRVVLTDLHPNLSAFERAQQEGGEGVEFIAEPVNALEVPEAIEGFRTIFASFHHFHPNEAERILKDAALRGRGIAVLEFTERNFMIWGLPLLLTPVFFWAFTPFVRPFRWSRLLWTYLVPLVPLMGAWDGFVSCLRTYCPEELEAMTRRIAVPGYRWEIGRVRTFGALRVTFLFGFPCGPRSGGVAGSGEIV